MQMPFSKESLRVGVAVAIEALVIKTWEISYHQRTSSTICSSVSNLRLDGIPQDHSNRDNNHSVNNSVDSKVESREKRTWEIS